MRTIQKFYYQRRLIMRLQLERWNSTVLPLLLVTDNDGALRALEFVENEVRMRGLLRRYYGEYTLAEGRAPASITRALAAYFEGEIDGLTDVQTATGGTKFQREVWKALREIPAGTTVSYGQLAAKLGREGASRAVGAANGANPIPIVVPCHRVIGADGSLTGFGSGLPRKRWLLDHEARFAAVGADLTEQAPWAFQR
jgi:methylated-DNA-[protein]-cysteine S-methyltransferase